MEVYLFEPETYARLYNCSAYRVEDVPLAERQHTALGASLIVLFVIFELLYIPCIMAIVRHLQYSSYKLMFYIGVVDMLALCVIGFATGVYAIEGAVFCSHPTTIYWLGLSAHFFWFTESTAGIVLATNRCLESWYPHSSRILFDGWRTWVWLVPVGFTYPFSCSIG